MRRKCPGLKPVTEAMDCRKTVVGEHSILAEAVPKGAVDGILERMPV
jgi:hypothetical protein